MNYSFEKTYIEGVLGIALTKEELDEYIEKHCNNDFSELKKSVLEQKIDFLLYGLREELFFIGKNILSLEDEKTLSEQKNEVLEKLKKIFLAMPLEKKDIKIYLDEMD